MSRRVTPMLGGIPAHRDLRLADATSDRHWLLRGAGAAPPLLSGADRVAVALRSRTIVKAPPLRHATELASGCAHLEAFLAGNLLFHDGDRHRRLRSAANTLWLDGRADRALADTRRQIAEHLGSFTVGERYDMGVAVGDPVTRVVIAAALGVDVDTDVVDAVVDAAPVLNALVTPDGDTLTADKACARLFINLERELAAAEPARGLLGALRNMSGVDDAVTLAAGAVTAGVEATRAFAVECAFAAQAAATARQVMDHASPVATALYGATVELRCGAAHVGADDMVVANLEHLSFGYGPHFCLGARLALEAGDAVISTLQTKRVMFVPDEPLRWRTGPLTRTIEGTATLRSLLE